MTNEDKEVAVHEKKPIRIRYGIEDFPKHLELYQWCMDNPAGKCCCLNDYQDIADSCARAILDMALPMKLRFLTWWKTGELIDDISIKEYSIGFLVKCGVLIPYAFIDFDALYSTPDNYFVEKRFWQYEGIIP